MAFFLIIDVTSLARFLRFDDFYRVFYRQYSSLTITDLTLKFSGNKDFDKFLLFWQLDFTNLKSVMFTNVTKNNKQKKRSDIRRKKK